MQGNTLNLHTPLTSGVGFKGQIVQMDLCFVIYMFLSNNPSSGDVNSANLSCLTWSDWFDHVNWRHQEWPDHMRQIKCDPVVPGANMWRDPTHKIKLPK